MINLWLEPFSNGVDRVSESLRPGTILVQLLLVGHKVGQVELVLGDLDLLGHVGAETAGESLEVDKSILIRIKHILHKRSDLLLGSIHLVGKDVVFEVFVGHVAVPVHVEASEGFEEFGLAFKCLIFNLPQQISEPSRLALISTTFKHSRINCAQVFVGERGRRVRTLGCHQGLNQFVYICLKYKGSNRSNISRAMSVVNKGRHEAFQVLLGELSLDELVSAGLEQEVLELVHRQVTVFVSVSLLSQMCLKSFLCPKLLDQVTIDFDESALDQLNFIRRDSLRVENSVVISEHILHGLAASDGSLSARDACRRLGKDAFVGLEVIVEATNIICDISIVNLSGLLVLEVEHVVNQLFLLQ